MNSAHAPQPSLYWTQNGGCWGVHTQYDLPEKPDGQEATWFTQGDHHVAPTAVCVRCASWPNHAHIAVAKTTAFAWPDTLMEDSKFWARLRRTLRVPGV